MKQYINEAKQFQKLAGIINEGEAKITPDNRVNYLAHTLETIWLRGRNNNKIDYTSVATSLIEDMFGSDEQKID